MANFGDLTQQSAVDALAGALVNAVRNSFEQSTPPASQPPFSGPRSGEMPSEEFKTESGSISIPRSTRREALGKAGLVGKVELTSDMNEDEIRTEICEVFAAPMGLTVDDIKTGKRFNYTYLLLLVLMKSRNIYVG
uniref:Uncharacterized protein n=1 Tax=Amphimedon queenslandica TaxID=400682 RepID=A0A1X7T8Y0_AMPQE